MTKIPELQTLRILPSPPRHSRKSLQWNMPIHAEHVCFRCAPAVKIPSWLPFTT